MVRPDCAGSNHYSDVVDVDIAEAEQVFDALKNWNDILKDSSLAECEDESVSETPILNPMASLSPRGPS